MARALHATHALCPRCDSVVPAQLVEREGDVYLDSTCPRHGNASHLHFRDASFFRDLLAVRNPVECCETFDCARGAPCTQRARRTMIYMVNVTNNCNMSCDACLSGSEVGKSEPYRSTEELLRSLPDPQELGFSPHVVFFGGEPTMHPELPEMVREVTRRGFVPRLATNGLRLRDRHYCDRLAGAGLSWVFLHFDSLDDRKNQRLRGRPMVDACAEALTTARAAGMKAQLGATISSENIDELSGLVHFCIEQRVFWLSLYPVAEVERAGSFGSTYLTDVVDALSRQTEGDLTRADFVQAARLWSRLFRATGRYNFRQKPTMLSLPVVVDGRRLVPVSRFTRPASLLGEPRAALRFARALPSLLDYEKRTPAGDTLVLNIQQFQGRSSFDLEEAVHSLMSFAHEGSFLPFDVFNHVHRWADRELVPPSQLVRSGAA